MKSFSRTPLDAFTEVLLAFLVLLALAFPAGAAQSFQTQIYGAAVTNDAVLVLTNGTTTLAGTTNVPVSVFREKRLGLFIDQVSSAASTSNVTYTVEFSADGTRWLTAPTATVVVPLTGTTPYRFLTNFPVELTANMTKVRLKTVASPAIATFYVTNAWFYRAP